MSLSMSITNCIHQQSLILSRDVSQTSWTTYSNTLPLWLIIVTIQFDSSIISVAVLFHLLCGSLTQYASQFKHFANIPWAFSVQCCFPINFFECLSCKSPCTFFVIMSLSFSPDLTKTILIFPSLTYSLTNFFRISMCYALLVVVTFWLMKIAPMLSTRHLIG